MSELYNISSSAHPCERYLGKNHALCHYRITAGKYLWCVQLRAAGFVIDCSLYRNLCGIRMDFEKIVHKKEYDNRLQCRVNRIIISIEPSIYPSNLAGSTREACSQSSLLR